MQVIFTQLLTPLKLFYLFSFAYLFLLLYMHKLLGLIPDVTDIHENVPVVSSRSNKVVIVSIFSIAVGIFALNFLLQSTRDVNLNYPIWAMLLSMFLVFLGTLEPQKKDQYAVSFAVVSMLLALALVLVPKI